MTPSGNYISLSDRAHVLYHGFCRSFMLFVLIIEGEDVSQFNELDEQVIKD